jgi:hypothetical protein
MLTIRFKYPLIPIIAVILFSSVFLISCDQNKGDESGGFTGDVGNDCTGLCKNSEWCFDSNLPLCTSHYCVGSAQDKMYCTQMCETQEMCPDGFSCTIDCNLDSSDQPYCVTGDDYDYLVSIEKCDPLS